MKNWRFSTNISLYFEKGASYGQLQLTTEDEWELVCDLSNGAILKYLE